jgi:hypothetical protein
MRVLKHWMLPLVVLASACSSLAGCGGDDSSGSAGMGGQGGGGAGSAGRGTAGMAGTSSGGAGQAGSGGAKQDAGPDASDAAHENAPDVGLSDENASQDTSLETSTSDQSMEDRSMGDTTTELADDSASESSTPDTSNIDAPMDEVLSDAVSSDAMEASVARPKLCFERCDDVDNCATRPGVMKWSCNHATGRCATCTDDLPCIAAASTWTSKTCTTDGDCATDVVTFGDVCIDVKGVGYCAYVWNTTVPDGCKDRLVKLSMKKFGSDSDTVDVCSSDSRFCELHRGTCLVKCKADTTCSPASGGKHCNVATGRCECSSNTDCGSSAAVCNTDLKQCECDGNSCLTDGGRALSCEN